MGTTGLGPTLLFARMPIRNMTELRKTRLWAWDLFGGEIIAERKMGLSIEPAALERASHEYDEQKVDGFISVPTAALAFQWSARARYVMDLRIRYLTACVLISHASLDRLPIEHQNAIRASFAKGDARMEALAAEMTSCSAACSPARGCSRSRCPRPSARSSSRRLARRVRRWASGWCRASCSDTVEQMLADYRAEHASH